MRYFKTAIHLRSVAYKGQLHFLSGKFGLRGLSLNCRKECRVRLETNHRESRHISLQNKSTFPIRLLAYYAIKTNVREYF